MGSPDGNGSSTGEGRKGALLLVHGRRPTEADGTSERASTLPSSNALRPDSGLNLGWYRPAPPEERPADDGDRNSHGAPRQADEPQSTVLATAARVDLRANPAPSDPSDSPLGARRPRGKPASSPQRETGLARVGVANVRRLAAALLGPVAREVRKRPRAVGIAVVLLVAVAVVTAHEQPGVFFAAGSPAPPRRTSHPQSPARESSGALDTRRPPHIVLAAKTHHSNRRSRPASHSPNGAHHHASTALATSAAAKAPATVTASHSTVSDGSAGSSPQTSPVQTRATTPEPVNSSSAPRSGRNAQTEGSASSAQPAFGSNGTLGPGSSPQS